MSENFSVNAVTVCVNRAFELRAALKQNAELLDRWVVVTSEDDAETRALIRGVPNMVEVLGRDYMVNGRFNKSRLVVLGLEHVAADSWVLLLDSDTFLPANFRAVTEERCARAPKTMLLAPQGRRFTLDWTGEQAAELERVQQEQFRKTGRYFLGNVTKRRELGEWQDKIHPGRTFRHVCPLGDQQHLQPTNAERGAAMRAHFSEKCPTAERLQELFNAGKWDQLPLVMESFCSFIGFFTLFHASVLATRPYPNLDDYAWDDAVFAEQFDQFGYLDLEVVHNGLPGCYEKMYEKRAGRLPPNTRTKQAFRARVPLERLDALKRVNWNLHFYNGIDTQTGRPKPLTKSQKLIE